MGDGAAKKGRLVSEPQPDPRRELVDRVAASSAFQKSNRIRELFLFLCGRALADPGAVIREQEIGVEVFDRTPGYDTAEDNLVRVQASQLRKKLQQYFTSEGQNEPVVIDIPKGSYTPVFRPRETAPVPAGPTRWQRIRARVNVLTLILAVVALVASASSVWLAVTAHAVPPAGAAMEPTPALDRLWLQIFGNGRPACLVPSDSNLVVFQNLIGQELTLNDYRRGQFLFIADEMISDPGRKAAAKLIVGKPCTHVADAELIGAFSVLNASHQIHSDVVFARDFGTAFLESHNVILMGTRRANPWLELYEGQLNFRTRHQDSPLITLFDNHAPLPGEFATYPVEWGKRGYCRVAFLPNPNRSGNVLIISGTDMASTQAGGRFVASERWVSTLRKRLRLAERALFPYFEVLLRVEFPTARAPAFDIVAHRIPNL